MVISIQMCQLESFCFSLLVWLGAVLWYVMVCSSGIMSRCRNGKIVILSMPITSFGKALFSSYAVVNHTEE